MGGVSAVLRNFCVWWRCVPLGNWAILFSLWSIPVKPQGVGVAEGAWISGLMDFWMGQSGLFCLVFLGFPHVFERLPGRAGEGRWPASTMAGTARHYGLDLAVSQRNDRSTSATLRRDGPEACATRDRRVAGMDLLYCSISCRPTVLLKKINVKIRIFMANADKRHPLPNVRSRNRNPSSS